MLAAVLDERPLRDAVRGLRRRPARSAPQPAPRRRTRHADAAAAVARATLPGHSPAFYIGTIAVSIVAAIALKNVAFYTSLVLAARLKRRIAVAPARRPVPPPAHRRSRLFDRMPGGDLANVFLVETYRTTLAIDAHAGADPAHEHRVLLRRGAVLPLVAADDAGRRPRGRARARSLSFVYGRLKSAGVELTDLNHRLSSAVGQSFSGIRIVRATQLAGARDRAVPRAERRAGRAEERSAEALSLLFPITETLAVAGAMVIVTCAYIFFVRPGHMLSSYLLAYGFILLRLLPLLNQLYGLHGHLTYLAGGIREVQTWLATPHFPERPFGDAPFDGLQRELRFEHVAYPYPNGTRRARRDRLHRAGGADRRDRRPVGSGEVHAREHPAAPARADDRAASRSTARLLGVLAGELASRRPRSSSRTRFSSTARCARTSSTAATPSTRRR